MQKKDVLVIHAWVVHEIESCYYLPFTHWIYLDQILLYYNRVVLLAPVLHNSKQTNLKKIVSTVEVEILPYSKNYTSAAKHFFSFMKAYRSISKRLKYVPSVEAYIRYPVPFGWLSRIYFSNFNKRIVHFVGDPMDAAIHNPNFNHLKKWLLVNFFRPEHLAYMWACKTSTVFTNGLHLKDKLSRYGVESTAVISSTLSESDYFFDSAKRVPTDDPKLIYVGYLRRAKGIETVLRAFALIQKIKSNASLTIVGSGEFDEELKQIARSTGLKNVHFTGHVEDRSKLNNLLRTHDFFCFGSLSEGSPRVILEAMANGINVVSTPVGSLPKVFNDGIDIVFAEFNDEKIFAEKILGLLNMPDDAFRIRKNAFNIARSNTIENFLKCIFYG